MKPSRSLLNDALSSSDDKTFDDESESDGKQSGGDQKFRMRTKRMQDQKMKPRKARTKHIIIIHEVHTICAERGAIFLKMIKIT